VPKLGCVEENTTESKNTLLFILFLSYSYSVIHIFHTSEFMLINSYMLIKVNESTFLLLLGSASLTAINFTTSEAPSLVLNLFVNGHLLPAGVEFFDISDVRSHC